MSVHNGFGGANLEGKMVEFLGLIWRNVWNGTAASTRSDMSRLEMWTSMDAVSEMGCSCRLKMVESNIHLTATVSFQVMFYIEIL